MEKRQAHPFRRVLAVLLCVAMLASYVVLPSSAADGETTASTVTPVRKQLTADTTDDDKLHIQNFNAYTSGQSSLIIGDWLQSFADSGKEVYASLKTMYDEHVHFTNLMPLHGRLQFDAELTDNGSMSATPNYNTDGSVTIRNNISGTQTYSYAQMNYGVTVDLVANPYIYLKYSSTESFNAIITFLDTSDEPVSVRISRIADNTDADYGENANGEIFVNFAEYLRNAIGTDGVALGNQYPASGKLTIANVQYYVSGSAGDTVTLRDFRFVSNDDEDATTPDADSITNEGIFMDKYIAILIEHLGTQHVKEQTGEDYVSSVEGADFFVDAVIDCGVDFDEYPHQIKAKTQYGFVMYIPKTVWDGFYEKPARGDLVDVSHNYNALYTRYTEGHAYGEGNFNHFLTFYDNPTDVVKQFTSDATTSVSNSVNATVQMFNYDANINSSTNRLSFWNGYWGFGGNVESEDGAGIEDNTYRYPNVSTELGEDGYPAFYLYVEDENGAYYKTEDGKYVLVTEADNYTNVVMGTKYSVDKDNPVSLGYLFGSGVTNYGTANANGVTAYAPMANGGGLFRHDPNTGNYFYDSMQNAAWYNEKTNSFELYETLIVRPWYNSAAGDDYNYTRDDLDGKRDYNEYLNAGFMNHASYADSASYGNFLPFNQVTNSNITLDGAVYEYADSTTKDRAVSGTDYSAVVLAATHAGTLEKYGLSLTAAQKVLAANKSLGAEVVDNIAEKYQYSKGLYTARLEEELDMWFGMSVDFDFFQPYNGQTKTSTGQVNDMVFDFEGDDDVFVYIGVWTGADYDYKLVLDIGGVHEARKGLINFATGAVEYTDCNGVTQKKTLGQIFDLGEGNNTFADFTKLSLKFFYMERGGNISCCRLSFNIPTLPDDSLTISKALDKAALGSQEYQFRVLNANDVDGNGKIDDLLIPAGAQYTTSGTGEIGTVGENGCFTLIPGQSVTFGTIAQYAAAGTQYIVEETITSADADGQYTIQSPTYSLNGSEPAQAGEFSASNGVYVYRSAPMTMNVGEANATNLVGFTNLVEESKLGILRITKVIKEGANISKDASFDIRVKLGGFLLPVGTKYTVTNGTVTSTETVTTQGVVTLKDGQTAIIDRILSTSEFEVTEISYNTSPSYSYTNNVENTTVSVTCTNSGASGIMPLDGDITITVTNDDSSGLVVDKTVASVAGKTDEFVLTLEAFATGKTSSFTSTTPADIVLVLDQSASMYAPKGATSDSYTRWNDPDEIKETPGIGSIEISDLNSAKGSKLGYYVAQTNVSNRNVPEGTNDYNGNGTTGETIPCYDWFIVQYVSGTGWVYVRVGDTTTSVTVDTSSLLVYDSPNSNAQYNKTIVSGQKDSDGEYTLIDTFNYYESQYAALYESVNSFVNKLSATGVDHRIAITGFSSPYYDGKQYYDGSGVYVGSDYYLYDSDYKYVGLLYNGNYVLYAPTDRPVYQTMNSNGILPDSLKGKTWVSEYPAGMDADDLIILDVSKAFSARYFGWSGETTSAGENVLKSAGSLSDYLAGCVSDSVYQEALVSVGSTSVTASIEAITTNFQQTCPAAGLEMAQQILKLREDTTRDEIVILFTDGTPTVGVASDYEHSASEDAEIKETYWSGLAGARDAIELANEMKNTDGIQIYTIGTSGLAANVPNAYNVTVNETLPITGEQFLEYVSSNYASATAEHNVTPGTDTTYVQKSELVVTPGVAARAIDYTKTSDDGDISVAFNQIMQSVSQPSVTLDGNAVLKEYLSDYFDLNCVDESGITVYVAPYTGKDSIGMYTFGAPVLASTVFSGIEVTLSADSGRDNVVVNVTGFDYSANYVHQETGTPEGYKIIVEVPIKDRAGFWGGNGVPTNKDTTAIYDKPVENGGVEVQDFPMPEVNIPVDPEITANNVTVYYGSAVSEQNLGVTIKIGGVDVTIKDDDTFEPAAEWMDDYAALYWDTTEEYPDMNPVNSNNTAKSDKQNEHLYAIKLDPDGGDAEFENLNPSNTAGETVVIGTPVTANDGVTIIDQKAETEATVYVLVPVITFKDATIAYGKTPDLSQNLVGVEWVNSVAGETAKGEILGSAPTLVYTYTSGGTTAGGADYTSDTMIQVTVKTEAGVDLMSVVTFKWQVCNGVQDSATHAHDPDGEENASHSGTADSFEFWIHVSTYALEDAVVIDFGLSVDIHVLLNDRLVSGQSAAITGLVNKDKTGTASATCDGIYGTATIEDGVVTYTLNKSNGMEMKEEEIFYYVIEYKVGDDTETIYAKITIIPATTIYFEDRFLDYSVTNNVNGEWVTTAGGWETDGTDVSGNHTQDEDRPGSGLAATIDKNNVYGYDSQYIDMATYSMGSAKWVTVDADKYATATFSFYGTGFDVISLTSSDSGTIGVIVSKYNDDNSLTVVENYLVDTYYGYTYGNDPSTEEDKNVWYVDDDASDTLYQVPVIKVEGMEYGHYQVQIIATYAEFFDHKREDGKYTSYDFYLDAIRIYDPANDGANSTVVKDAYIADGEGWPTYVELRNLIITANTFDKLDDETVNGIIFIDGNKALSDSTYPEGTEPDSPVTGKNYEISDYINFGPNNELYLDSKQAIAFKLEDDSNVVDIQLALKTVGSFADDSANDTNQGVADGDGKATVTISYIDDNGAKKVYLTQSIETATDMYYSIKDLRNRIVIIENTGDAGILSITNVKITYSTNPYAIEVIDLFGMTENVGTTALAALNADEEEEQPEQNVPGTDVEENPTTGDLNVAMVTLLVLTFCVMTLAVLVISGTRKRNAK